MFGFCKPVGRRDVGGDIVDAVALLVLDVLDAVSKDLAMPRRPRDSQFGRAILIAAPAVLAVSALAAAAPAPPALTGLGAWATAGSRVAFVATIGGRSGLWQERLGSNQPTRIGQTTCGKEEQADQLAAGPGGSWGCLEQTVGNSGAYYSVDVIQSNGVSRHVATAGGPTGSGQLPVDSIPQIFGDDSFLGYLHLTTSGVVQLMRVTGDDQPQHVADLAGVSSPKAVAIAASTIAILDQNGDVSLFTVSGEPLATIEAKAASIALSTNRVVVRTVTRRLAVYGLRGGLVHSWPLGAATWTAGLATDGRYAVYLGANKAVRAVKLATGTDRIVMRAGSGWFFNGLSLQAPGAVVPLTTQNGKAFLVNLRFLPIAALKGVFG